MNNQNLCENKLKPISFSLFSIVFLLFCILSLVNAGCGGGGGGSDSLSVSPSEEEVRTVLNRLTTSINATDTASTMALFDSNLKYYKYNPTAYTIIGYNDLKQQLGNFFAKAASISVRIDSPAVLSSSESSASARGMLVCTYKDTSGAEKSISEEVEIVMEKSGIWGITEFYRYDRNIGPTGTNFPPTL